jgi:hypothetical protein
MEFDVGIGFSDLIHYQMIRFQFSFNLLVELTGFYLQQHQEAYQNVITYLVATIWYSMSLKSWFLITKDISSDCIDSW